MADITGRKKYHSAQAAASACAQEIFRHGMARPRLNVYRSNRHVFVQVIDDVEGRTLVSCSTIDKELAPQLSELKKVDAAKLVGQTVAARAKEAGIECGRI